MRTLVAVPCMDMMHTQFVHSLLKLRLTDDYEVTFGASSLIYDTRNSLVKKAVDGNFDRILWFDSDMVFEPNIIDLLNEDLDKGYGIVTSLYFKRRPPFTPVIFSECDIKQLKGNLVEPIHKIYEEYPKDTVFEVAGCGFGCVMIDVSILKKMVEKFGRGLFAPVPGFGEDLSFCLRARHAGYKIYCDSRVKLGHVGEAVYSEETWNGINR